MKNLALCLINVALLCSGQILFKFAARDNEITSVSDVIKLLITPYMIFAIVLYAVATILWVYILTKIPLSYAHPIQALAFPIVATFSIFIFGETVPLHRWIGIGVILLGAVIVSR